MRTLLIALGVVCLSLLGAQSVQAAGPVREVAAAVKRAEPLKKTGRAARRGLKAAARPLRLVRRLLPGC